MKTRHVTKRQWRQNCEFQTDESYFHLFQNALNFPNSKGPGPDIPKMFSNLLGSVYKKGNLLFTPDGNSVMSPVGNRVTVFDLKNNKSETLPIEARMNITCIALSPDGYTFIVVSEDGEALLCSLVSKTILHTYHFHSPIHAIKFSPDGKKFAVTRESKVLVFHAPGRTREYNPFVLHRTFYGPYDETVCLDWTSNSSAFCVGSKDMNTRVFGAQHFSNLIVYSMGGHNDVIMGAYFEADSLDLYTISANGRLNVWDCDTDLDGLKPFEAPDGETSTIEAPDGEDEAEETKDKVVRMTKDEEAKMVDKILYKRTAKHSYKEARGDKAGFGKVTSTAFHKNTHILVTGFEDGVFFLHEMPDFNLIHSLSISDQNIASIEFNKSGDWIAFGCSGLGQLLVWEWQSETYVLKQQGHFNNMNCLAYSPDAQNLATGGDDGKVKVWNTSSGFCFVTFTEHLAGITGVTFNQKGQVVLSSSLDGTVRAFDLNRYRNFRTFTSPRPTQFSCLAIDPSGDIVCAGAMDSFEIFVWSMQTGRLLEVLAGHEGPISSLSFSPTQVQLASASWDNTVKIWDVFEHKGAKETLNVLSHVLCVAYHPGGVELAVSGLNAQISFWDTTEGKQLGTIEGRHDIGYSRKEEEKITAKKSAFGKAFNTICYSADGNCILAAGRSKNVCIYSVADKLLMKKFEISCNLSFDGMEEFLDKRKMTEFGSLALVDSTEGTDVSLPGVKKGDMSSRHWKPEVRVSSVQFSPTGRAWAATTTEGLLIYSLDHNLVFDPFDLELDITPSSVKSSLAKGEYSTALMLSFRLNEQQLIQEVLEMIPVSDVEVILANLPDVYVDKLMTFIATLIESTAHIEFYLIWARQLLMQHGPKLKQRSQSVMTSLRLLQKNVTRKLEEIGKICDHNKYSLQYIISLSQSKRKLAQAEGKEFGSDTEEGTTTDREGAEKGISIVDPSESGDSDYMDYLIDHT
ncbi:periodic tryptophan protein 2 homolog isoform X2 [Dreissena polymorpha]|uniref:periodic tryptophan protein 2 homolog isoform X2 n=1 Tax=Dreissena polymorpha TaxID=45954 RepID=UPI002263D64B|nr:periodic tryptophan protein 2 homolog isoform X2 [Dreissena polymorpha]